MLRLFVKVPVKKTALIFFPTAISNILFPLSTNYFSDLMWTLYGFLKNLPDKNATVDSFVDYSIGYYHTELMRLLKNLRVNIITVLVVCIVYATKV